jgi:hypothetical protein
MEFIYNQVLLLVLWGKWIGDLPHEDLTKFDYMLEKKLDFFEISLCFGDM